MTENTKKETHIDEGKRKIILGIFNELIRECEFDGEIIHDYDFAEKLQNNETLEDAKKYGIEEFECLEDTLDDDEIIGGYIYQITFDGAPTDLFIKVPHRASDSIGTYVTCEEAFEVVQKTRVIEYWAKK
mgnify:FL=1